MSGLQTRFQDQVDFIHLDWDDPDSDPVLTHFNVFRRSTYLLIDPQGTVLWQWVGPLQEPAVTQEIQRAIDSGP